jgi:site-specific recombinase XerD
MSITESSGNYGFPSYGIKDARDAEIETLRAEVERLKAEDVRRKAAVLRLIETVRAFYHFASGGDDIDEHRCRDVCDECRAHGNCESELRRELETLETLW